MLSRFDIQKLQDLPIEQVAEAIQISVSRHKAICPFHDDTRPSLTFNTRRNRFRCFVCETNGSTIDLVMKSQGWTFYDSCRWLAKQFNVVLSEELGYFQERTLKQQVRKIKKELPPPPIDTHYLEGLMANPHLTEEAQRFLFEERKISPDVVRQIGLSSISEPVPMSGNPNGSWFNGPSLLIPYRDINGKLLSVQARYLGADKNKPRFQFPKGSQSSTAFSTSSVRHTSNHPQPSSAQSRWGLSIHHTPYTLHPTPSKVARLHGYHINTELMLIPLSFRSQGVL